MEVLIEEYKIDRRVRALAHKITEEHRNSGNPFPPVKICVLNGAFMFFSDLVKDNNTMLTSEERLFSFGESSIFLINTRENNLVVSQLSKINLE